MYILSRRRWLMPVLTSLATTSNSLSPNSSASAAPWWDGMKFQASPNGKHNLPIVEPLLYIPCGIIMENDGKSPDSSKIQPVTAILDTSLSTSTLTQSTAVQHNWNKLALKDDAKQKFLPAGAFYLRLGSEEATLASPALLLVQDDAVTTSEPKKSSEIPSDPPAQLRLGLDFLRSYAGIIDLKEEDALFLNVEGDKVLVPFVRHRPQIEFGEDL